MNDIRVAGIMRVKNEGKFIKPCVESCIDALDELIIVYNDCTDNSAEEINKIAARFPDKIKCFSYPYHVYTTGLSKDEFEYVSNLPEDSPNLFSTYCNFALSKVTCQYAVKIDADQIYFSDYLKEWCDSIRQLRGPLRRSLKTVVGYLFQQYLSLYRRLSMSCGRPLPLLPKWLLSLFYPAYIYYAKYLFSRGSACLALSGINVLDVEETLISMGRKIPGFVTLPPFNGEGDTVIFPVCEKSRFVKYVPKEYNKEGSKSFCVFESFVRPAERLMFIGFFWKHVRTNRDDIEEKALNLYNDDPTAFLSIPEFKSLSFREIQERSSKEVFRTFQRVLFSFVYKANKSKLFSCLKDVSMVG